MHHESRPAEHGIPIRNIWHMLLYAWGEVPLEGVRSWPLEQALVEEAPGLDALLASALIRLVEQRLRLGLGGDYIDERRALPGIRGRIDFSGTIRTHALERGQLVCEFQGYRADSPRNRIIRSTLARLAQTGQFGPSSAQRRAIQHRLRRLLRDLDGIALVELSPELIRRQLYGRGGQDHDYRLMLSICDLVVRRQMPGVPEGGLPAIVPSIDPELLVLYQVYERFVANFYRLHLEGWDVSARKRLEWHAAGASERLPQMVPDILLKEKASGRMVILDTKYTPHSLRLSPWGREVFDSSHLYQIYAYLKSQEHLSEAHRTASGILLYPAAGARFSEAVRLQGQLIRLEAVDLAAPWQEIEQQLLALVHDLPGAGEGLRGGSELSPARVSRPGS